MIFIQEHQRRSAVRAFERRLSVGEGEGSEQQRRGRWRA